MNGAPSPLATVQTSVQLENDRRISVWCSRDKDATSATIPVVVCSGFCRKMRHMAVLSLYLVRNGASVYRFDPIDHVGLSDGDVTRFTMSGLLDSVCATVRHASEVEGDEVRMVAASLSFRAAVRAAVQIQLISHLVGLVGVVNLGATLRQVFDIDYLTVTFEELPEFVKFERHTIDPRPLWFDDRDHDWLSFDSTINEMSRVHIPVTNIYTSRDSWVDSGDVASAFADPVDAGPRAIVELPFGEHDLSRNPVALRLVLAHATRSALGLGEDEPIYEPTFDEIRQVTVSERRLERASIGTSLPG